MLLEKQEREKQLKKKKQQLWDEERNEKHWKEERKKCCRILSKNDGREKSRPCRISCRKKRKSTSYKKKRSTPYKKDEIVGIHSYNSPAYY
ncbi:hypothetical protein AVEN_124471-1 [Araneus ventricosus]|uniref:Uncharacterized protein n=1 Tax=Araneus ventricosus TaxID=182803 RepID=A0A4Y2KR87_ARAVE|nr:hypothetical protein AVEN_124471-1 [Araneus ventricosus]